MNDSVRSVILLTHGVSGVSRAHLEQVLALLGGAEVSVFLPASEWDKHADVLHGHARARMLDPQSGLREPGTVPRPCLCVVLGGDGTMLRALRLTSGTDIPVAGFNLGRMGFLTTGDPRRLSLDLPRLLEGEYYVHDLMGLSVDGDVDGHAVNDVVVQRPDGAHVCALGVSLNGVGLYDVLCDGVVAATPAGSSAYSLAAGGPLLGVDLEGFVVTMVAAHAIGVRPIVAAPGDQLRVTNRSTRESALLVLDGERVGTLEPGEQVQVCARRAAARLALLPGDSLYAHFQRRFADRGEA